MGLTAAPAARLSFGPFVITANTRQHGACAIEGIRPTLMVAAGQRRPIITRPFASAFSLGGDKVIAALVVAQRVGSVFIRLIDEVSDGTTRSRPRACLASAASAVRVPRAEIFISLRRIVGVACARRTGDACLRQAMDPVSLGLRNGRRQLQAVLLRTARV